MEKRSVSQLVLAASAAVVLLALIVLVVKVRAVARAAPEVEPVEPAHAREAATTASRSASSRPSPGTATIRSSPGSASSSRPSPASASSRRIDTEEPPQLAEARRLSALPHAHPRLAEEGQGEGAAAAGGEAAVATATPGAGEAQGPATEAVQQYDRGEYEKARAAAVEALEKDPADDRMLRIATSASCILGDADQARTFYARLSPLAQRQIGRRCSRYGVQL